MGEYDCITVPIEKGDLLSPPSSGCHKDFEVEGEQPLFLPAFGKIAASAILAFATYSVALPELGLAHTVTPPTNSVIIEQIEPEAKRSISLSEACRMAQEFNERIDAAYEELLESEASVAAVWEEGE